MSEIKTIAALRILKSYSGGNPYFIKLKGKLLSDGKLNLTNTISKYIISHHDKEPEKIDRIVEISDFLGESLMKDMNLPFKPNKIYIGFILGETQDSYHVYGKIKKNQPSNSMFWVPKTQLITDIWFKDIDIDIDFDKYSHIDSLKRIPFNHQKSGVKFLLTRKKCILADDMGLGKTYMSIIAAIESGSKKTLIICPDSAKINWQREISMFSKPSEIIRNRWRSSEFVIINYDILSNYHTVNTTDIPEYEINNNILMEGFDTIIIDEAHYIKDKDTIRGSIIADIAKKTTAENIWLLTGTPVSNRPKDLYNLLNIIKHPTSSNFKFYIKRYCEGKMINKKLKTGKTKKIWITNGASNLDELSRKTRNHILRRLKSEVVDMPPKIVSGLLFDLNEEERNEYDSLWDEYIKNRIIERKKGVPERDLVELILFRKYAAKLAIKHTIELAREAIENGNKVIIFTSFNDEQSLLAEEFGNLCVCHNGSMSDKKKQQSVDEFQNNNNIKVFIGNIISAGVAITLTKANVVIFNSFDWVPGNNEQAEDRAYRIGQTETVNVYYILFHNAISTRIWGTLKEKKNIITQIIGTESERNKEEIELIRKIIDG